MSRLGKRPIIIPQAVKIAFIDNKLKAEGPLGVLERQFSPRLKIKLLNGHIQVERMSEDKFDKSLHGLTWKLISNMITGVSRGFEKMLEIKGLGYRAQIQGKELILRIGYTNPCKIVIPADLKVEIKEGKIRISGMDKQLVGEFSARIRNLRRVDPYKEKGIKYEGEYVKRKAGKAMAKTGAV